MDLLFSDFVPNAADLRVNDTQEQKIWVSIFIILVTFECIRLLHALDYVLLERTSKNSKLLEVCLRWNCNRLVTRPRSRKRVDVWVSSPTLIMLIAQHYWKFRNLFAVMTNAGVKTSTFSQSHWHDKITTRNNNGIECDMLRSIVSFDLVAEYRKMPKTNWRICDCCQILQDWTWIRQLRRFSRLFKTAYKSAMGVEKVSVCKI